MSKILRKMRKALARLSWASKSAEPMIEVDMPGSGTRRFYYRETEADRGVIYQMFEKEDYSLRPLKRGRALLQYQETIDRPLIIDAGSNIGSSVVWFAQNYPKAHIVGFEPDRENFDLLRRNSAGLNADLYRAALGAHDGKVSLIDQGEGAWGYRTEERSDGDIDLVSMSRVVREKISEGFTPFLVKIDIEGGEGDLFSENTEWIDEFPLLIIELHDWFLPAEGTSRNFLKCIAARDRDFVHIGENIFSIRNEKSV